jgi:hypothetical protein
MFVSNSIFMGLVEIVEDVPRYDKCCSLKGTELPTGKGGSGSKTLHWHQLTTQTPQEVLLASNPFPPCIFFL